MKTNVEIKINQCMSCPFAHQVISDYSLFYSDYVEYDKNKKPYDEDFLRNQQIQYLTFYVYPYLFSFC